MKSLHRVISSHDVRSIICADHMLFSGGVDTYLTLHQYPAYKTTISIPPSLPCSTGVKVARDARCLLLTYSQSLQLWRLGRSSLNTGAIGSDLPLDAGDPCKLVEVAVKSGETIVCSAVHSTGQYLAYSTNARLRLLSVSGLEDNDVSVSRIPLNHDTHPCHHICLWSGSEDGLVTMMTLSHTGAQVYKISETGDSATLSASLSLSQLGLSRGISRVSHNNNVAVIVDNTDTVISLDLNKLELISKFPGYTEANISALSLSPDNKTCFIAYSNNRVMEVDTMSGRYTKFSREEASKLPKSWLSRRTPVNNIVHLADNTDLVLMTDHSVLAVLDKDKEMPEPSSKLFFTDPRSTPDTSTDSMSVSSFGSQVTTGSRLEQSLSSGLRMSRMYDHLVSLHHLDKDEIVVVEVKPSVIESQLPPSIKQKKFGSS